MTKGWHLEERPHKLRGMATGIGSLPHKDVQAALDLIFKYIPQIPFWPQLPNRDTREGMVAQFSQGLAGIEVKELEKFYEKVINQDLEYFKITQDYASGLYAFAQRLSDKPELLKDVESLKCHTTGPFTFAASIKDENGKALLHEPVFMQAIIEGLKMKALWQIRFLEKFAKKIIMFLDEPYLGAFGSAYTPINREDVIKGLSELTGGIKSKADVLLGVHCCGNTDWSIFTEIKALDIINFDAFGFLDKFTLYADNLKEFIKRGGIICWGIVPTSEFSGQETPDSLRERLDEGINVLVKKGLDKEPLLNSLLLSPSCGLGSLDTQKSDKIFKLLSEVSFSIRGKTP
ncbi:MAG: methionine synthase [Candidatus Omnitrophica bacterium]|nr:methionine synthase [Candidatus Omnitrophota bacterium]MCG2706451.1 methionine synthase [Candidatus Omnitrophota bacterium]